jgi:hypothetical protein
MNVAQEVEAERLARDTADRRHALLTLEEYSSRRRRPGWMIAGALIAAGVNSLLGGVGGVPWVVGAILVLAVCLALHALVEALDNAKCLRAVA